MTLRLVPLSLVGRLVVTRVPDDARFFLDDHLLSTGPPGLVRAAPGEHTVPVEWYQPGCALVLENRDGRQCPVGIHISLQPENSSKGAKPVGTFSLPSESRDPKRVYATPLLPEPKRAQLVPQATLPLIPAPNPYP